MIPRTPCGYYPVQTNLPGPLSLVGMIFPSRLESTQTPEEAGMSPSTMLFLLAGRSLKKSRLHCPLANQPHLFPHTMERLPPRWGHGHPQHWSSRDVFYFKKTQQEIHRLWTPGYFQAVWGRDCQIQWTTGTVVSQGHRCYCSLQG